MTHNDFVMSVQVKDCIINCLVMQWKSFALELLQDHDFLLIQEHWLVDCQFHLLSFDGFSTLFVSGFDSTKILHPFDGCAIIYLGNLWHVWLNMSELRAKDSVRLSSSLRVIRSS